MEVLEVLKIPQETGGFGGPPEGWRVKKFFRGFRDSFKEMRYTVL